MTQAARRVLTAVLSPTRRPSSAHPNPSSFTDNLNGLRLRDCKVWTCFWGKFWAATAPGSTHNNATTVYNAVKTILSSRNINVTPPVYMSGLAQYGIQNCAVWGSATFTKFEPSPRVQSQHITNFIQGLVTDGTVQHPGQEPDQFYIVFLPPGIVFTDPSQPLPLGTTIDGEHGYFNQSGVRFAWGVVTTYARPGAPGGPLDLDRATKVFSHELVEACTDTDALNPTVTLLSPPGLYTSQLSVEIADTWENETARIKGVLVQKYWSQRDRAAIAPGAGP